MKRVMALALLLLPISAAADKRYLDDQGGNWDCKTDPIVSILGNDATYVITGPCQQIAVQGNHNTVAIATVKALNVNGNSNTVTATTAGSVHVMGNENKVHAKSDKISNMGDHNVVDSK
jgi:hypothetical protein